MKRIYILFLLLSISIQAQIPNGYYNNAQGLTGYQLKTALKTIITNGHTPHSYGSLYTAYQTTDIDHYYENDGTILDMYSENPNGPDPYNYTPNANHCGNYSHEGDCFNREHTIPQNFFNSSSTPKGDAHFVVPSDGKVNGMRSNYPYGIVNNPTWTSQNGSKLGNNSTAGYSSRVFEPIDEFKGDLARMAFYFATRYENNIPGWYNGSNSNTADMFDGSSHQVFSNWFLQILLQWHYNDPVSQREIDRNNAVYNYQGNRNPYIDHPEWVAQIWDPNNSIASSTLYDVVVYPNPTNDNTIHIKVNQNHNLTIKLFNLIGQSVDIKPIKKNNEIILSNLPKGFYMLKINNGLHLMTKKIIVR